MSGLDDVIEWLGTEDARVTALAHVRRYRLPNPEDSADELLQQARLRVLATRRGPDGDRPVDVPAAYGNRTLRNAAVDLVNGGSGTEPLDGADLAGVLAARGAVAAPADEPSVTVEDPAALDRVRLAIEARGGPPWLVGAALHVVTLIDHGEALAGLPWPDGGADRSQAHCWQALALVGLTHLFPAGPSTPAVRQDRSRRIRRVLGLVRGAATDHRSEREDLR